MHYSTTIQCILCANETDIVSPEILPTVEEFLTSSCSEPFSDVGRRHAGIYIQHEQTDTQKTHWQLQKVFTDVRCFLVTKTIHLGKLAKHLAADIGHLVVAIPLPSEPKQPAVPAWSLWDRKVWKNHSRWHQWSKAEKVYRNDGIHIHQNGSSCTLFATQYHYEKQPMGNQKKKILPFWMIFVDCCSSWAYVGAPFWLDEKPCCFQESEMRELVFCRNQNRNVFHCLCILYSQLWEKSRVLKKQRHLDLIFSLGNFWNSETKWTNNKTFTQLCLTTTLRQNTCLRLDRLLFCEEKCLLFSQWWKSKTGVFLGDVETNGIHVDSNWSLEKTQRNFLGPKNIRCLWVFTEGS